MYIFIQKLKKKVEGIHDEKNQSKAETEDERDAVVRIKPIKQPIE